MGKGDKKTKRGKISNGTFGVRRPHHKSKSLQEVQSSTVADKETIKTETPSKPPEGGAKKKTAKKSS